MSKVKKGTMFLLAAIFAFMLLFLGAVTFLPKQQVFAAGEGTVYWGVSGGKLTISSSEVGGTESGSFPANEHWVRDTDSKWRKSSFTSVEVTDGVAPLSTAYWFYGKTNLTSVDLSGLVTANVTDMSSMFYLCRSLTEIDLSAFNTENVTSFDSMFAECAKLTYIDISSFSTASATDISGMFYNCSKLSGTFGIEGTAIKIGTKFNTANVTDMSNLFGGCKKLTYLDISSFNTAKVTSMRNLFYNCSLLSGTFGATGTAIKIGSDFSTSNVTNMSYMFG